MRVRTLCLVSTIVRCGWITVAAIGAAQPAFAEAASADTTAAATSAATAAANGADSIVVTGTREQSADAKRQSKVVLDVRSLQEIRSLPDVSAAEVLQRLPGVSMESDSGEGRFVNIRGMDADLNGTTYDGVRLTASNPASPQGGARAVAFDAFPSGILGGIEVIKSLSPDMDAEGLGGVVNILPRLMGAKQQMLIQGGIGGGYETLRKTGRYQGDLTLGGAFGGTTASGQNRFEILVSYSYDEDKRGIDDVEADYINDPTVAPSGTSAYLTSKLYDDLQPRWYEYHRIRQGISGSLVFRPDDNSELFIRGLQAGYTEGAHKHEFQFNGLADSILAINNSTGDVTGDAVTARQVVISTRERLGNSLIEAGGKTVFGSIKVDGRASFTRGYDTFPFAYSARWGTPGTFTATYNNTANYNVPSYHTNDGTNLLDPTIYTRFSGHNSPSHNEDKEWSGVLNFAAPLGPDDSNGEIKFGGGLRARNRIAHSYRADFINPGGSYAAIGTGPEDIFYNGAYTIGPAPDFSMLKSFSQTPLVEDPTAFENDKENIYAGYGEYSASFGSLSVVGGVRVERTEATYRANVQDDSGTITPNTAKHNYTNVFPDLSLTYDAKKDLVLRAAYTTAIGRPGFNEITAAKSIDTTNFVVSQGNPSLKPTIGHNLDLALEYYTPHGGLVSVGAFYKAFDDYIIATVQRDVTNYPDPRLAGQSVELDSFQNIGSAHAQGIEFNLHQPFYFLPGPLNGLGFDGNLTLVDSSGQVHQTDLEHRKLPQTSPLSANASLYYEKGPISARIAASYVSKNLWAVGGDPTSDLYSQPRFRLDASVAYWVNRKWQIYAEAKNLTNTKLEFTQTSDKRYPVQREYYDMDVLGGIRFNFGR